LFESGRWVRTGDQTGEEGLASEISVVLLEVLLSGSAELDSSELEAAVLEAGDDGTNEATLGAVSTLLIYYGRPLRLQWPVVLYLPGRHQA
jgi:hypothetical protein